MELAAAGRSGVDDGKAKVFLERIEVAVAMQQGIRVRDAERGNQAVNCGDRVPFATENPIILGGLDCQLHPGRLDNGELQQIAQNLTKQGIAPESLQHFAKNHIGQAQCLRRGIGNDPPRFGIFNSPKAIHPHG